MVLIQGNVEKRSADTQNKELKTGMIEIKIKEFEIVFSQRITNACIWRTRLPRRYKTKI